MAVATLASGAAAVAAALIARGEGTDASSSSQAPRTAVSSSAAPSNTDAAANEALVAELSAATGFRRVDRVREALAIGDRDVTAAALTAYVTSRPYVAVSLNAPRPGTTGPLLGAYNYYKGTVRLRDVVIQDLFMMADAPGGYQDFQGMLLEQGFEVTGGTGGCTLRLDDYADGTLSGSFRCGLDQVDATLRIE